MFQTLQRFSMMHFFLIFAISVFICSTHAQDWPTGGSIQPEFEITRKAENPETPKNKAVSRGQLHTAPSHTENLGQLIRREVINPFENGVTRSSAPLVQTLPEEVEIPEIPDVLIYEQINLDEFRHYLESLIAEPPVEVKPNYSEEDIKQALKKVSINTLAVKPLAYVVVNKNKFRIGDRFSLAMPPVKRVSNIEMLIENQMPDKSEVSEEVYKKFVDIRDQALLAYQERQQAYLKKTGAHKHNISVIVKDIKHRKLIVSVRGKDYVIPIRLAL